MSRKRPREEKDEEEEEDEDGRPRRPAARVAKSERLMNLISFLLQRDEPVPVSTIVGKVSGYNDGTSRDSRMRRFERDKQVLKEMGVPIAYDPPTTWGPHGYRIPKEAYYLGEVKLPQGSTALLSAIHEAAGRGPKGELANDLRSALLKLGVQASDDPAEAILGTARSGPAAGQHLDLKLGTSALVGRNLEVLIEAVVRRKRISMRYYTISRDEETTREVDPYGLGYAGQAWNKGAWYLVGHCHLRNAPRIFKVDRIRGSVKVVKKDQEEGDFERPADFAVKEHLNKARWEMRELALALGGGPARAEDVLVRFPSAVSVAVRELVPSTQIVEEKDGTTLLRFHVQERRAFCRFLLPYVGQLEIVSPRELDSALEDLAREVLARYEEPASVGGGP